MHWEEATAIFEMARTQGWEFMRDWLEKQIEVKTKALVEIDMTHNVAAASLQGEIRGLRMVLSHVDFAIKQHHKREDEQ